jgi:membrane-bound lytic murein transglycosylase A
MRHFIGLIWVAILSTACTTVPETPIPTDPPSSGVAQPTTDTGPDPFVIAQPLPTPPPAPIVQTPRPAPSEPPPEPVIEAPAPSGFAALPHWSTHDSRPALFAFAKGCETWAKAEPEAFLNVNLPQYGQYRDWFTACQGASVLASIDPSSDDSRNFFEAWFKPVSLKTPKKSDGLLTGYYEPEVDVRLSPDATFSEPILAKPTSEATLKFPRSKVNARTSRVIAYGRPIDVFFLQIQGSGRLKYGDGRVLRAAYAANNGQPYTSIGGVLIRRGELTREQASKQAIANWMARNGREATRALMNENSRYIYFTEQAIRDGEGPQGAMRVPLTGMGAIAVDPRYHPYGSLAWLETTLPTAPGDYRGVPTGLLVTAQDTGSAIKGPLRADLFFGSGDDAGARAGVQKHAVRWTLILPRYLSGQTVS